MSTPITTNALDTMTPDGLPSGVTTAPVQASNTPALQGEIASAEPVVADEPVQPSITDNDQTEVNFADFSAAGNQVKPAAEPVTPIKPIEPSVSATTTVAAKPLVRDYSALPPEIRDHAKKMSNEAFAATTEYVKKLTAERDLTKSEIAELKKGRIPDSYLEHPDAYILTPEFTQAARASQEAQTIFAHWETQLNEVRQGALEYKPLVRGQDGGMYYGTPVKADANTETSLLKMFNAAQQQAMQFQGKVEAVKAGFTDKHNEAKTWLQSMEQNSNQVFNDEKNPLSAAYKQTLGQFPSTYKANPLAPLLAKSMVANGQLMQMLQQANTAKTTPTVATVVAQQRKAAGPNMADIGGDGNGVTANKDNISIDDFKQAMW
jgi:hypothetical protein